VIQPVACLALSRDSAGRMLGKAVSVFIGGRKGASVSGASGFASDIIKLWGLMELQTAIRGRGGRTA